MKTSKSCFPTPRSPSQTSVPVYNVCPHCKQELSDDCFCALHGMTIAMKSSVVNRFYPQQLSFVGVIT
jgi:hypothetical protein